jgi:Apoptosis inhibitory protein 5 (API5)
VLIDNAHGPDGAKQLSAQFLARFASKFDATVQERALNALMHLCVDDNETIVGYAVRALLQLCKDSPSYVNRVAVVLTQLLPQEIDEVYTVLAELFTIDAAQLFDGMLSSLMQINDEKTRSKAVAFVIKLVRKNRKLITADEAVHAGLAQGLKNLLVSQANLISSGLSQLLHVLRTLPAYHKDPTIVRDICSAVLSGIDMDKPLEPTNDEAMLSLKSTMAAANRFYNSGADCMPILRYFCDKIVPVWDQISGSNRRALIRPICVAVQNAPADAAMLLLPSFMTVFHHATAVVKQTSADGTDSDQKKKADIDFVVVEACLFAIHSFCHASSTAARSIAGLYNPSGQPSDFSPELTARKEETQSRLKFVRNSSKRVAKSNTILRDAMQNQRKETKEPEARKALTIKIMECEAQLKAIKSVGSLMKRLLGHQVSFLKSKTIVLSWRATGAGNPKGKAKNPKNSGAGGVKRKKPAKGKKQRQQRGKNNNSNNNNNNNNNNNKQQRSNKSNSGGRGDENDSGRRRKRAKVSGDRSNSRRGGRR